MSKQEFNDVTDYIEAGGNPEVLRETLERAEPISEAMLKRVVEGEANSVPTITTVPSVTGVTGSSTPFKTISAAELHAREFAEPEWIVPGLLPVGLAILAGRPKAGKSWLALNLGISVANGGLFLGNEETVQGEVLYLALEDSQRRLQRRLNMILDSERLTAPPGLHFSTAFPRFNEGGFDQLRTYLQEQPEIRLVILDTLARLRGKTGQRNGSYANDYEEIGELQEIALQNNVAFLAVHHTTKMNYEDPFDSISGTSGVSGAADTLLLLARSPELNGIALQARGRDIEEQSYAVQFDPLTGLWVSLGETSTVKLSVQRKNVIDVLRELPEGETLSPQEIAERTEMNGGAIRKLVRKMTEAGEIENPALGRYKLPVTVGTPVTASETDFVERF